MPMREAGQKDSAPHHDGPEPTSVAKPAIRHATFVPSPTKRSDEDAGPPKSQAGEGSSSPMPSGEES